MKKRIRRNLTRNCFLLASRRSARHRAWYRRKRLYDTKFLKERVKYKFHISKPRVGTIFIKHRRRNTFLTLSRRVKNRATNKFGILTTKRQFLVSKAMSIGHLRLYKGRGKSSKVAFKALAHV